MKLIVARKSSSFRNIILFLEMVNVKQAYTFGHYNDAFDYFPKSFLILKKEGRDYLDILRIKISFQLHYLNKN